MIANLELMSTRIELNNKTRTHDAVRVFIIDSNPVYREGLIQRLKNVNELEIIGITATMEETPRLSRPEVDVIIVDMDRNDPRVSWSLLQKMKTSTDSAVLPLSYHERDIDLVAAYSLHCSGWLLRRLDPVYLINSIQYAPKGSTFDPIQTRRVLMWKNTFSSQWMNLRNRELEIFWMLLHGKSNSTIAQEISCSEHTVEKYVSKLLQRFEKPSRTALIAFCYKNHLDILESFPPEVIHLMVAP